MTKREFELDPDLNRTCDTILSGPLTKTRRVVEELVARLNEAESDKYKETGA